MKHTSAQSKSHRSACWARALVLTMLILGGSSTACTSSTGQPASTTSSVSDARAMPNASGATHRAAVQPAGTSQELRPFADQALQRGLERCITDLGLDEAVSRQELCVALVDISDGHTPRLAMINGEKMMYAASLPKIAILLGAFDRIEKGELSMDADMQASLTSMIRNSSNIAATRMLNMVGQEHIIALLTSPRLKLYDAQRGGGLWVGKDYEGAGAYQRDPVANLAHGATAYQVARFYYLLETERLLSPQSCTQMKDMLSRPAIRHKFVAGLKQGCPTAQIYRKSGTWSIFHADSGIIEHGGKKYIAVGLAANPNGGKWLERLIVGLDNLVVAAR